MEFHVYTPCIFSLKPDILPRNYTDADYKGGKKSFFSLGKETLYFGCSWPAQ